MAFSIVVGSRLACFVKFPAASRLRQVGRRYLGRHFNRLPPPFHSSVEITSFGACSSKRIVKGQGKAEILQGL